MDESQAAEALSQANPSPAPSIAGGEVNDEQTVYEVGFHVLPTTPEGEVGAVVDIVRAALASAHAEIINEKVPTRMTLAYTIERSIVGKHEKYTESYFGAIKFAVEPSAVPAIMNTLRGTHAILRFIIIETTREETPSPRRALFTSKSLEGKTIEKPVSVVEKSGPVSEGELDKSIEALIN